MAKVAACPAPYRLQPGTSEIGSEPFANPRQTLAVVAGKIQEAATAIRRDAHGLGSLRCCHCGGRMSQAVGHDRNLKPQMT